MYIDKKDKIVEMLLINSHDSDMTYQRPDKTTYVCQIRKDKPNTFYIPQIQIELPINLPKPTPTTVPQGFPHQNMLQRHYGEDWKPIPDPNLIPH